MHGGTSRRFHACVEDEEGAPSQRALSPCRWLVGYRHTQTWAKTFGGLACHCRLAAHQNSPRPYQPSLRRTLELQSTVSGGQVPDIKARFWGDSRYFPRLERRGCMENGSRNTECRTLPLQGVKRSGGGESGTRKSGEINIANRFDNAEVEEGPIAGLKVTVAVK